MYDNRILTNVPSYRIIDEVGKGEGVWERRGGGGGGRWGGEDILLFNSMSYK